MKRVLGFAIAVSALSFGFLMVQSQRSPAAPKGSGGVPSGPIVMHSVASDISLPMTAYPLIAPSPGRQRAPENERRGAVHISPGPDPVFQDLEGAPLVTATVGRNFTGLNARDGLSPPDTNASVGATEVVEIVNSSYQVFDKATGRSIFGPAEVSSVFTGLSGNCGKSSLFFGDPVVVYDKAANRWLITILEFSGPYDECIAVSTSSLAEGSYARYDFKFNFVLPDYPKFGVWPDAYYAGYNTFNPGSEACAYDRSTMLSGGSSATAVCFQRGFADFSFLPGDLDGSTPPKTGEPDYFLSLNQSSSSQLNLYKFHVDFTTSSNSTFTGPTVLSVGSYSSACGGGSCIPQPGTTNTLDSLADRLMFRLAYRNFGDHEALVVTHSVKTGQASSGARWYEIRSPGFNPLVFQQGTVGEGANSLWMGSIAMDKVGDIALGFSVSSKTIHPSIQFTGRVPTDPRGMMESIAKIKLGTGSQTNGLDRWGDYTSMSIDPSDDCTFWYANEWLPSNGSDNWTTQLASLKFPACL